MDSVVMSKEQLINDEVKKLRKKVSELEKSEAKLKQALNVAEERFRAIAEATPDGIVAADSTGKIIYWNKGAEKITGYTRRAVLEKSGTFFVPRRPKTE